MKKIVNGSKISFYDNGNTEIMCIDYLADEYVWRFNTSNVITITEDAELYESLIYMMQQQYTFNDDSVLKNYKDKNKLIWYSDCYYNPDSEYSVKSVSYLTIEYIDGVFKIWCTKPLDKIMDRKSNFYAIAFSPLGNGQYSKNNLTGLTLQDEFVLNVYHKLLDKTKIKKLEL